MTYPPYWTSDHKRWYHQIYLNSDHWKGLRLEKLRVNPCCENCKVTTELDIHHVNYRQLFDVQMTDLKTLCRKCHTEHHITYGFPKRSEVPLRRSKLLPLDMLFANKERAVKEFENFSKIILFDVQHNKRIKPSAWKGLENKVKSLHQAIRDWQFETLT